MLVGYNLKGQLLTFVTGMDSEELFPTPTSGLPTRILTGQKRPEEAGSRTLSERRNDPFCALQTHPSQPVIGSEFVFTFIVSAPRLQPR